MKLAAVHAIAELAHAEQSEVVASAYGDQDLSGAEYIIPKPFDPRLIVKIAPAVAKAAMDSGVATRPIADFDAYIEKLSEFVYKTNLFMKPISPGAQRAEAGGAGGRGRYPRAARDPGAGLSGLAKPILIGRPGVIEMRIQKADCRCRR
jgi:malate dehydrogenase (oxaloacetate-decarboxylating)(NADP+)